MKQRILICGMLVLLVLAAHAPALRATFVWDDTALVLRDPLIRSWRLIPEGFQHFLFVDATPSNFYRPLQRVTYTLEYWAFAFRPAVYHCTNVFLHAAAAVAFFVFAAAFLGLYQIDERKSIRLTAIVSAAWAVHPLHSGVVDYVSGRADSLAALFGFIGLYFFVRALRVDTRLLWKFYAAAALALLASALSKENGLIFSALAIVFVLLRKNKKETVLAGVAFVFVVTLYLTLRSQVPPVAIPRLSASAPLLLRPIIAARALAEYTGLVIAPANLHMERDVEDRPWGYNPASLTAGAWRELETLAGLVLCGSVLWWMWRAFKRGPVVFALLLCAGVSYLPVCGLFSLNANIAEHWIYVPLTFALLAAAVQVASVIRADCTAFLCVIAVVCLWIVFLGIRSFYRAQDWQDPRTFFTRTIAAGGDSARMLINLAGLELSQGHLDQADALLHRALAKNPEQPFALLNLAAVALKRNDLTAARAFLERAQRNPVSEAQAEEMLAIVEQKESGQIDLLRLRMASRGNPPSWSITRRYLAALVARGQMGNAVTELETVLKTEWYRAESWQLLADYLTRLGEKDKATTAVAHAHAFDVHLIDH
jgi:protein O-mannosyl-transferase